jgi:glutathione S-transferase
MQAWYAAALQEPFREASHEAEVAAAGTVVEDLRVPAA